MCLNCSVEAGVVDQIAIAGPLRQIYTGAGVTDNKAVMVFFLGLMVVRTTKCGVSRPSRKC
jgi:hypothetical protein